MADVVIVGAGGFGAETASLVEDLNRAGANWHLLGFLDDDASLDGSSVIGYPVLGPVEWLENQDVQYVVAIGSSRLRSQLVRRMIGRGSGPATLVHPSVAMHSSSTIGEGSIICRGTTVTVRTAIGSHCIVNLHCTVGHDAHLADFTTLHPGVHVSGGASLGTATELGTGDVVLPGVSVGDGSIVGAGAVVTRDLPAGVVAVGTPARSTRNLDPL
jgi:sugar O-acyltransferase (sialic acid O-acetyltransferase NeuD family)